MAIQIIEENRNRRPSTSERFGKAFSAGAGGLIEHLMAEKQKKLEEDRYNQQISTLNRLTGMDFTGIRDPKILEKGFEIAQERENELLKQGNRQSLQQIYGKGLRGEKLTQEEWDSLPIEAQKSLHASMQPPKNSKQALTEKQVPPEISDSINRVLQENPNATSDQLRLAMDRAGIPPVYSNPYTENRRRMDESEANTKGKRIEAGQKRAEKILDKADALGEELPILESTITAMEDAVVNGDQSFWSLDNLAEMTGLELFRTAKGGQFKTAAKTYFINDLKASGARPNMFIEKQLSDALAKVGRSEEANLTVIESFKFSNDLKKKWHQTVRDLERYYEDSLGYLPGSFNRQVEDLMEPYVKDRQKQYEKRLRELAVQEKKGGKESKIEKRSEISNQKVRMVTPTGEEIFVPENEVEEALNLGAKKS